MNFGANIKSLRGLLLPFLSAFMVIYIIYHTFQGNYGFFSLKRLEVETTKAETRHQSLVEKREKLEVLTDRLSGHIDGAGILDLDLLEELARKQGFSRPGEVIISLPTDQAITQ